MGILQFYVFWLMYHILEYHILGCVVGIVGAGLQLIGLIKGYMSARTANGAKWRIGLLIGSSGFFAWLFLYYCLLIVRHVFIL